MNKSIWLVLVVLLILLLLLFGGKGCKPVLAEGTDCWTTAKGTKQTLPTLPEDFFGPGSQEISAEVVHLIGNPLTDPKEIAACGCPEKVETVLEWKDQHGNTVDADSKHAVSNSVVYRTPVDTCVRRLAEAKFDNTGVAFKVGIELVELSLQSVRPITVQYLDGLPEQFDVFITDTPPQKAGTMSFTADNISGQLANGTIEMGALHVNYQIEFRQVDDPTVKFTKTAELVFDTPTPGTFKM